MERLAADRPTDHGSRTMAWAAAGIYGAVAVDGFSDLLIPDTRGMAAWPVWLVAALAVAMATIGPRLPPRVLALNGPLGVALATYSCATLNVKLSDPAFIYTLPVIWQGLFFGRRGALGIFALAAVGEGVAAVASHESGPAEHWVGVMVSVAAVTGVVVALHARSERLLGILSRQAQIDPLTGLLNRRGFDARAEVELTRLRRHPRPISVVAFDVDHFKAINDRHGHDVGDQVLLQIAEILRSRAREGDLVARFGGEEFIVLLVDSDADGAERFADGVRASLAAADGALPAVRMSAGVREGDQDSAIGELLADADVALYDAKRLGRDHARVYAPAA